MKWTVFLVSIILLSSCRSAKWIEKNCDLFAKICITETETETDTTIKTKTEIKYRDTTIFVYIPGMKAKDEKPVLVVDEQEKPVPIKKQYINSDLSVLTVPFAKSYAQVVNSKLRHELDQTDTLLLVKLEDALKYVKTLETQIVRLKEKRTVTIKENSKFARITIGWFWISFIVIVILTLIMVFKNKILGYVKKIL